jgi:hypothetical protein
MMIEAGQQIDHAAGRNRDGGEPPRQP